MWGKTFEVAWHEEDTTETLKAAYQRERDRAHRTWLHGLWLLRSGWSLSSVAAAVGVDYRTVQRWVGWYRAGGVPQVLAHQMGGMGRQPFLTAAQEEELAQEVATGRFRTAAEIRDWISATYGVRYTTGSIYSLTSRLGCAKKVPRPLHAKADLEEQAAWKKGG